MLEAEREQRGEGGEDEGPGVVLREAEARVVRTPTASPSTWTKPVAMTTPAYAESITCRYNVMFQGLVMIMAMTIASSPRT